MLGFVTFPAGLVMLRSGLGSWEKDGPAGGGDMSSFSKAPQVSSNSCSLVEFITPAEGSQWLGWI